MKELIKSLSIPETSGKKIGLFRALCAIFGGLIVAYLGMTLLIYIIPGKPGESIVVPLLLNTMVWAISALWISLAYSKLSAILRVIVPTLIFSILIAILYNI
ncbi:hypothetical protein N5915_09240 [Arcobacter lacus]|uniref:DUF3649 domain-containing protein n=1 Tax=Arcobacter lacus TaxID=1912876 RepID=A0ABX5JLA2_9BACT|nr:hypothetical protein [Arcobacter lacus]MCT7909736.1 hypothetical protein [Arcobacter lacus]PUE65700.1 hypothetical protein B0175_07475 [Arcobacter lacus]